MFGDVDFRCGLRRPVRQEVLGIGGSVSVVMVVIVERGEQGHHLVGGWRATEQELYSTFDSSLRFGYSFGYHAACQLSCCFDI